MKNTYLSLSAITCSILLAGCGGGGGSSSSAPTPAPAPAPAPTQSFNLQPVAEQASIVTISVSESLIQISNSIDSFIKLPISDLNRNNLSCSNGGLLSVGLTDTNSNSELDSGDRIQVRFSECYQDEFDDILDGTMDILVENVSSTREQFSGQVDLSDVEFVQNSTTNLNGIVTFDFNLTPTERSYQISSANVVDLIMTNEHVLSFTNTKVLRKVDFATGKYSVISEGQITHPELGGTYSFSQKEPWVGFLLELPHEGEMELKTSDSDVVTLKSNFVVNSELIDIVTQNDEISTFWSGISEGAFWSVSSNSTHFNSAGQPFSSDNFRTLGIIDTLQLDNFPLDGEFRIGFNRPITEIVSTDIFAQQESFPFDNVKLMAEVNGAVMTVKAEQPLEPGREYSISSIEVRAQSGTTTLSNISRLRLTASTDVIPVISTKSTLFKVNDTPLLSAADSELNNGSEKSYQWYEVSDLGVTFLSANGVETDFNVPTNTTEDIVIGLRVSNEFGQTADTRITLQNAGGLTTFFAIDSEVGDFIGQGRQWFLTPNSGQFSARTDEQELDYINIDYNGDTWWHLDLAAPSGEELVVKKYTDATRYPFQSPTKPGLSYTGDGRGCNGSSGEFEIMEIEFDSNGKLSKLAANFIQSCETVNPPLNGIVRFNSSFPINQ